MQVVRAIIRAFQIGTRIKRVTRVTDGAQIFGFGVWGGADVQTDARDRVVKKIGVCRCDADCREQNQRRHGLRLHDFLPWLANGDSGVAI